MTEKRDDYYSKTYKDLQRNGIQGWGNSLIDRLIEKRVERSPGMRILELGASSGEHLRYVSKSPEWAEYVGLDIRPGVSDPEWFRKVTDRKSALFANLNFIKGNAESIPYSDNYFDLAISTCLLAHVQNPERVLFELRRVVRNGGQIVVGLPADPGALNRLVKTLITYPKMKSLGIQKPKLEYAREHINGIGNLIELIKNAFADDQSKLHYFPTMIPSWNANVLIVFNCRVRK